MKVFFQVLMMSGELRLFPLGIGDILAAQL
jgi:hypothetical protein